MHLLIVTAFGLLIWRTDQQPFSPPIHSGILSVAVVVFQVILWWVAARLSSSYALRRLRPNGAGVDAAQYTYHRISLVLRILVFAGFAADLFLTRWPQTIEAIRPIPPWSAIADLIIISPFLITVVAVWQAQFPIDHALRKYVSGLRAWEGGHRTGVWSFGEYLSFNVRYQMLTVAVPMTVILLTYRLCQHHRRQLADALLFPWVPDALLVLVAAAVFILAPVLLKSIWATSPLPTGPLRQRLEEACRRTGLRCRDILVWDSHGMVINAAVMGIFARFRYVLLSDGLLEGLKEEEIEAVFGHEAGHVRHHHMQYFLLFALVSILLVSGVMEIIVRLSWGPRALFTLSETAIQGIGLGLIALFWGVVFGWLSRRFERQADVCGVRCVSPTDVPCGDACGVHPVDGREPARGHPLCVAGAKVFVTALDQVAILNGIPQEERSWRHSSIASRMRFLMAQAGDPALAGAFHKLIRNIKRTLWTLTVVGLIVTVTYSLWREDYRRIIIHNTLEPLRRVGQDRH